MTTLQSLGLKVRTQNDLKQAGVWKIPLEDLLLLTDENLQANGLRWTTVTSLRSALRRKLNREAYALLPRCECGRGVPNFGHLHCHRCETEAEE